MPLKSAKLEMEVMRVRMVVRRWEWVVGSLGALVMVRGAGFWGELRGVGRNEGG